MATTIPAIKGTLGATKYYLLLMSARELVKYAHIPSQNEWKDLSIEERYQREMNYARIKNSIVPYLREYQDRFIGAVILATDEWDENKFEPAKILGEPKKLNAYNFEKIGFYTFNDTERLIILDGQHRVKAMDLAITADENEGPTYKSCVAKDEIAVLLIENDIQKARKIFTKVNTNARKPMKGQVLITDDDDVVAVLSRKVANKLFNERLRLVELMRSSLGEKDYQFITFTTLAAGTEKMLENAQNLSCKFDKSMKEKLPSSAIIEEYEKHVCEFWSDLFRWIEVWNQALTIGENAETDEIRKRLRSEILLMRPMPMEAIVEAISFEVATTKITRREAIEKVNNIPWQTDHDLWDRVLISGGKIQVKNSKLVTNILKYIIRDYCCENTEQEDALSAAYKAVFPLNKQDEYDLRKLKELATKP